MRLASIATAAVFVLFVRQVSAAGFERATVPDPMDKPLEVAIWYPSAAPISQQRDNPAGQSLALDGPINGEHLPLIVVSYGNGGSSDSHADTALALADAGFVVAAVKEELHCRHALLDRVGSQLPVRQQMKLKPANVLRPELIRRPFEISSELPQCADIGFYGTLGIITALEFLQHHFSKMGHRDLLVTEIYPSSPDLPHSYPHA